MRVVIAITTTFLLTFGLFTYHPALAQTNSYFPLEPGLHYSFTSHMAGSPMEFMTVVGTEQFYGREVWAVQVNYFDTTDSRIEFYSIGSDGDVFFHGLRLTESGGDLVEIVNTPPYRILDMPVSLGKTWADSYSWMTYINGVENETVPGFTFNGEIIATDSPVTVPAGSFSAVEAAGAVEHISGVIPIQRSVYWLVKDIGPVRRDNSTDGQPEGYSELLWSLPVAQENQSWGSVKAIFR
jgi:hypothetical protein